MRVGVDPETILGSILARRAPGISYATFQFASGETEAQREGVTRSGSPENREQKSSRKTHFK